MKLFLILVLFLAVPAFAQRGGSTSSTNATQNYAGSCTSDAVEGASCGGFENKWCVNYTTDRGYACGPLDHVWHVYGNGQVDNGDYGDITVSNGGNSWSIDNIYLQNLATGLLAGNYVEAAGNGGRGVVTGTTQSFSGLKTFLDGIAVPCIPDFVGGGTCAINSQNNTVEPAAAASGFVKLYALGGRLFTKNSTDGAQEYGLVISPQTTTVVARCGNVAVDPTSINATTSGVATATGVTGLTDDSPCFCNQRTTQFNDDLVQMSCFGAAASSGTLSIRLYNPTAGAIDGTSRTVDYCCFSK